MKRSALLVAVLFAAFVSAGAQDAPKLYAESNAEPEYVYTDASVFPLYGKVTEDTYDRYGRLPGYLKGKIRDGLWDLGRHSAGLYIRFRTDSKSIRIKWESLTKFAMNHMTAAGVRGLDLYALDGGQWRSVRGLQPGRGAESDVRAVRNMDGQMREYMLYLSLYDGVKSVSIGTEKGSVLEAPAVESPKSGKPIVMYGTSILQGGCANRPGMAFTAILGRWLDREVINLGFSGNGRLDYEIADLMAAVPDPAVFVLDNVPNCKKEQIEEREENFIAILRKAHPTVPIIFVENPDFTDLWLDNVSREAIKAKNDAHRAVYEKLRKAGDKNLFYVPAEGLIGNDGEATVDGTHFTDLGMLRYAETLAPVLKKAIKKNR
ncbi:MAG: SGNH/GDSL hydrolase family protein [Bacteroidales bacterium]|nr:SGNH/GDSL hydrolase family protein [Bacteroidales bacterium]